MTKRGAKLSTDHQLIACNQRLSTTGRMCKTSKSRVICHMTCEVLTVHDGIRNKYANTLLCSTVSFKMWTRVTWCDTEWGKRYTT